MQVSSGSPTLELLAAAKLGDRAALETLFARYHPIVLHIVELRMGRDLHGVEQALDVVQETLLDVFRGLSEFSASTEGDFRNWLAMVAINNLRDSARRANAAKRARPTLRTASDEQQSSLSALILRGRDPSPSQQAVAAELEQRIKHALSHELPAPYREVLILRRLCGMDYAEIAQRMGFGSASSARALCTRASERLRACL